MAKKKAKGGIHAEVSHVWGWVTLTVTALIVLGVAGYYFTTMVSY